MPLPDSTISLATKSMANYLDQQIKASLGEIDDNATLVDIKIGNPSQAEPPKNETNHRVNLFFYLVEPSAFHQDVMVDEVWRIRMYCLVTVFGVQEGDVGPGENDMRLLGEVVRIFHEKPILDPEDLQGVPVRLQIIFRSLSLDDLNHLWSAQGDTTLRPSLAYEVSLVPVVPKVRAKEAPLVGQVGAEVVSGLTPPPLPYDGPFLPPAQTKMTVDQNRDDWTPQICLVYNGTRARALFFQVGSSELNTFTAQVQVAGKVGETVTLQWDVYGADQRWEPDEDPAPTAPAKSTEIDPENPVPAPADLESLALPFKTAGQLMLTPTRDWTRPAGDTVELRGEPVLITIYE
ncbi:MAG: DUF4255 domain-containing protein [Acidobacteriota bacterium]|nr:DUF4255 domain-containing protein [Acidobacteriota bacterium]